MCAAPATRRGSREAILDAAEALIRESGVNRMTLDAVAARAGLSKGGLLYNFPSKDALLRGMIERFVETLNAPSEGPVAARVAEVRLQKLASQPEDQRASNSMLAAIVENPSLLDPIRAAHAGIWNEIKAEGRDPVASLIAWLATEGLCFFEMFATSPLDPSERETVIGKIRALAAA